MKKTYYVCPISETSELRGENIICASNGGSSEDFGKGTGFSFDLFENAKPF